MSRSSLPLTSFTLALLLVGCSGSSDDAGGTDASATNTESGASATATSTGATATDGTSNSGSMSATGSSTGETSGAGTTGSPTTDSTVSTSSPTTTGDPTTTTEPTTTDPTTGDTTGDTTGGMMVEPVRFVVLGDGGEGNDNQYMVADQVEQICAQRGCDFALYLGDNFYDNGVDATDDSQFATKFEMPYADLDFPFYVVFGNHDYGLSSFEWYKADFEIEYTNYSDKWTLPDVWYDVRIDDVHFFGLDTTRLMWDKDTSEQQGWLDQKIAGSDAAWKIAFGHHPYVSNGAHGNAGNYEGLPFPDVVSGGVVEEFMNESLCNKVDVYFCGHDHNRQWHEPICGVEFIVSGAAAKTTDFKHHDDNKVFWEDDQLPGFLWVEIEGNVMNGAFYDRTGKLDYERTVTK